MSQSEFIAAVAANIAFSDYSQPAELMSHRTEWVIASSWGGNAEYLTLSQTYTPVTDRTEAPRGLQPRETFLAILLAHSGDDAESEYLLVRHRPENVLVGGVFCPCDGFVRILRHAGGLRITARGRYAHSYGRWKGKIVISDVPDPAPGYDKSRAWHMAAERCPWIGEFTSVPGDQGGAG